MAAKVTEIEVTYGQKRPTQRFSSELISVSLRASVEVFSDDELGREIHDAFALARKMVERQQWVTQQIKSSAQQ